MKAFKVFAEPAGQSTTGRKLQVVGTLAGGKSFTRYVVRHDGVWVGNNPDERAVDFNARAQAELAEAEVLFRKADTLFAETTKRAEALLAKNDDVLTRTACQVALEASLATLGEAKARLADAKGRKDHVERELPLTVEFVVS